MMYEELNPILGPSDPYAWPSQYHAGSQNVDPGYWTGQQGYEEVAQPLSSQHGANRPRQVRGTLNPASYHLSDDIPEGVGVAVRLEKVPA